LPLIFLTQLNVSKGKGEPHKRQKYIFEIICSHSNEAGIHSTTPMVMVTKHTQCDCMLSMIACYGEVAPWA